MKWNKPKVQVCVLTGGERQNWINPRLTGTLIAMSHDTRFATYIQMISDLRSFDTARNHCIAAARKNNADVCIQLDNDIAPAISPLDVLNEAREDMAVVGLSYGVFSPDGTQIATRGESAQRGNFIEAEVVGGGCLIIRSAIWKKIPGPWFRWLPNQDEYLTPGPTSAEDYNFCRYVRKHGFSVYTHKVPAAHYRTVDLTYLVSKANTRKGVL